MNRPSKLRYALAFTLSAGLSHAALAAEKVNFLIDWLPSGDKAAVYVGVYKGLFAAEGLEVSIASGRGSSDVVTKLATGSADMGTGGLAALLQARAESSVPVTAIASIYMKQADALFTTEGSGITSLKDIVGKKVATATFSSSNVVWPLILQANDVDPSKIELLKVDPGALAPLLASGQVAATINWVTVAPGFTGPLAETKKTLKILPWSDYGFDGYGLSVFASDKMLKEHPETVKKFMAAYMKAQDMAIADPALAAAALKATVPDANPVTAENQWKASIPLMVNEVTKKDGAGAFEPKLLAATWKWVAKSLNMPIDKIDPEKTVARGFVK